MSDRFCVHTWLTVWGYGASNTQCWPFNRQQFIEKKAEGMVLEAKQKMSKKDKNGE